MWSRVEFWHVYLPGPGNTSRADDVGKRTEAQHMMRRLTEIELIEQNFPAIVSLAFCLKLYHKNFDGIFRLCVTAIYSIICI